MVRGSREWHQLRDERTRRFKALLVEVSTEPLHVRIALIGVALLPLQQAFTLDVGFPAKACEALFGVAILLGLVRRLRKGRLSEFWSARWILANAAVLGLAVALVVSSVVILVDGALNTSIPGVGRPGAVDLAMHLLYGFFVLAAWVVIAGAKYASIALSLVVSVWVCAAAVLVQIFARFAAHGTQVLSSLGFAMDRWGMNFAGETLMRNGPFLEGQHLGFFSGAMFVFALFSKRYVTASLALGCAVYSMSTTAFIAVGAAVFLGVVFRPNRRLVVALLSVIAAAGTLIAIVAPLREMFVFQLSKLNLFGFGDPTRTVSLGVRSAKTEIGWRMMWDYPLGVGPGRFGQRFHEYVQDYPVFSDYIRSGKGRAIAENVYVQVGAELGVLGLASLLILLGLLLYRVWSRSRAALAVAIFVVVGIITQSSWTFLPIWVFLGLVAAAAARPVEASGRVAL